MNRNLPIYPYAKKIVNALERNDIVIIKAETGSGKSTQVPQFLLEAGYGCIVTQPRRIACANLYERVRKEIGDPRLVGYETAFESENAENAEILFRTDGLVLARGIGNTDKILVIDELHEWNLNMEALVALIRKRLELGLPVPKTVLMSATLDKENLADFYRDAAKTATIDVPGRSFPVKMTFVRNDSENAYHRTIMDSARQGKNTLAFRPGKSEIHETAINLRGMLQDAGIAAEILPLHAEMTLDEQRKCFEPLDIPKIVIATNVAQTSITIPDIDVVVDDGLERRSEIIFGMEALALDIISRADIEQRAGRAGRTKAGQYCLCSEIPGKKRPDFGVPEIGRALPDHIVLQLASHGMNAEEMRFFHELPDDLLKNAYRGLELIGALKNGKITAEGRILARYPISGRSAKMIEEGKRLGIACEMIKTAAIIESGGLVRKKMLLPDGRMIYGDYSKFTKERRSDLLAELDVFDAAENMDIKDLDQSGISRKAFEKSREMLGRLMEFCEIPQKSCKKGNDFYLSFLKCLRAGYPDHFHMLDIAYSQEYDGAKPSDISCVNHWPQFIFGFRRTLSFMNKYGHSHQIDIMEHISEAPEGRLFEILDPAHIELLEEEVDYDERNNSFSVLAMYGYLDSHFDLRREIRENDPDFEKYMEIHLKEKRLREISYQESRDFFALFNQVRQDAADIPIDGHVYREKR